MYYSLKFGIGQTYTELAVLEAIQKFLYKLPGKYIVKKLILTAARRVK